METMKSRDEYLIGITKRLDGVQERLGTLSRLVAKGQPVHQKYVDELENVYTLGLQHLRTLKATEELRAYTTWYARYLNGGDPL